jgi:hypothetical protein
MITEEQIRQTVSKAEEIFQDCWAKLSAMNNGCKFSTKSRKLKKPNRRNY